MTLKEYFAKQPRGAISRMATQLGVSRTWLSLIVNGHASASPLVSIMIERLTKGQVTRKVIRPDIY